MQKLVLYIGNKSVYTEVDRVDMFKDETVSFTQTIQNVRDIKKIFTEFTQTFSLPASKKNNKIFKHYYNFDIADGFDARQKVKASLELNDIPFKEGKIALTNVDLKNNLAHTYKITFFGNTVDLKDILGNNQLGTLTSLAANDKDYNYAGIKAGLALNPSTNDVIVPLITHTDRMYYDSSNGGDKYGNVYFDATYTDNGIEWSQFKYALKVNAILTAIQTDYPITFSTDFFNNGAKPELNKLFLWLHRKQGAVEETVQVPRVYNRVVDFVETDCTPTPCVDLATEQFGYIYTTTDITQIFFTGSLTLVPTVTSTVYSARLMAVGFGEIAGFIDLNDSQTLNFTPEHNRIYYVEISSTTGIAFATNKITLALAASFFDFDSFPSIITRIQKFKINSQFLTTSVIEFNILQQMPKMKIIDFLTGLFQMFNLTAFVNDTGTIVVKPLDDFYLWELNTTSINIDKYLDVTKSSVNIALPFKSVNFRYKGLGTFLAEQFLQVNNTGWGSLSYSLEGIIYDALEESYEIELPFEHVMYERLFDQNNSSSTTIQWGFFVNDNQESYIGEPLLFYPILNSGFGTTPLALKNSTAGTIESLPAYNIPSNSFRIDPSISKQNINFNQEFNEYTGDTEFTDTLFKNEYETYISAVFNSSRRLTIVTANLPYKIFSSIQLNDLIEIGQQKYWINSLTTDLTTGKTKFELLNKLTGTT